MGKTTGNIMGNTAENILNNNECSVLAVKPKDFNISVQFDDK